MGEVRKMGSQELWPSLFVSLFFIFASGVGLDPSPAGANRFHNPIETLQFHLIVATATATTSQTSKRSLSVVDV